MCWSSLFLKLDIHTKEVVKKSFASMIVKIFGMAAGLAISISLGRLLGPDGLGIVNLSLRIANILLVITMFGVSNVILKHVAIGFEQHDYLKIASYLKTSLIFNGLLAVSVSITGISVAPYFCTEIIKEPALQTPLIIIIAVLLPQTYSRIFASAVTGLHKIWQSNLVNETLSSWIVGFGLIVLYVANQDIDVDRIACLYAIARVAVTVSMYSYWKHLFNFKGKKQWVLRPILKMARPLLLVSSTSVIAANSDIVMLGWLSSSYQVGLYSVAAQISMLVVFFLQISNAAISPKLAALFADGRTKEMETMIHRVTGGLAIIALLTVSILAIGGKFILTFWGTEFTGAYWILLILTVGQVMNISTGCAGMLLMMTGLEKAHGYISFIFVSLNLILNLILIYAFGAIGAALATAITITGENITKVIVAKVKLGILTIPYLKKKDE